MQANNELYIFSSVEVSPRVIFKFYSSVKIFYDYLMIVSNYFLSVFLLLFLDFRIENMDTFTSENKFMMHLHAQ